MRPGYLPDSDQFLTVEDALLLITRYTNLPTIPADKQRFSREQNERALCDAHESGTVTLRDAESMRQRNPSKNIDSTRQSVTAEIKSSRLAAISATLWISLADFQRFADLRFVRTHFFSGELFNAYTFADVENDGYTIYDVENELGYTIQGAARALAKKYPVSVLAMRERIFDAATEGKLQVRDPKTGMIYVPKDRSNHHERISVSDLNQWFEESGVPYQLGDDSEDPATATAATGPRGINRREVMRIFAVKPKPNENRTFWDDKLGRPPKWLESALAVIGKRGRSSLWNPLLVAHALFGGRYMNLHQLDAAIREHLPELLEEWKEKTGDVRKSES